MEKLIKQCQKVLKQIEKKIEKMPEDYSTIDEIQTIKDEMYPDIDLMKKSKDALELRGKFKILSNTMRKYNSLCLKE